MSTPRFVTFEGIDGAGKTSQITRLADRLRTGGASVVTTREPGGAPGAEEIRRLLIEGDPARWSAETEILLFTAARRDHVERTIAPALEAGQIVLCDRYVDSTRAYQGMRGLRDVVDRLHTMLIGRDPDLTLILDLDPVLAADRRRTRGPAPDRFEQRGLAFQTALRDAFHQIAALEPTRCRLIDASGSEDEITAHIAAAMTETP